MEKLSKSEWIRNRVRSFNFLVAHVRHGLEYSDDGNVLLRSGVLRVVFDDYILDHCELQLFSDSHYVGSIWSDDNIEDSDLWISYKVCK